MPSYLPLGSELLVNANTNGGQISPRVARLADGRYMVIWVGAVTIPVVAVNGTTAASFANADIRAQIYNANGTTSGPEIIINTTTAGGQIRPAVTQLSDGNVLITWQDGVGPAGGTSETVPAIIRGQEFTSTGIPTGGEVALVSATNGVGYGIAATNTGGFVVTYQTGGVGISSSANPASNLLGQIFNANNVGVGTAFVIDNSNPRATTAFVTVEADNDIVVAFADRSPLNAAESSVSRFSAGGTLLTTYQLSPTVVLRDMFTLATGGHALVYMESPSVGADVPVTIFVLMNSADGLLTELVNVTTLTRDSVNSVRASPTPDGGFIVAWTLDTDPTAAISLDIYAQAYNAIGNPIGGQFLVNTAVAGLQNTQSIVALSNGDLVIAYVDDSATGGDTSSTAIRLQRFDYDPTNRVPTATDFTLRLGADPTAPVTVEPAYFEEFFGRSGYDIDGDPLVISAVGNATNGSVSLNADGTLSLLVAANATGPLSFNYTVSDGQGGTATARATVAFTNDFITVRLGDTANINFLANDNYTPSAAATSLTVSQPSPTLGGNREGSAAITSIAGSPRIAYNPLGNGPFGLPELNSSYFNLAVGQTTQVVMYYNNNEISGQVFATLQGWAQRGGTGADTLYGTALADHLSGGTGAGNYLVGGAGNDWYTVRVATDAILELVGGGIDSVRTSLARYDLGPNVENLYFPGFSFGGVFAESAVIGVGNNLDNIIYAGQPATGNQLYGLGGNDTLIANGQQSYLSGGDGNDILQVFGSTPGTTILLGGAGDDIFIVDSSALIVEYANQGFDTVRTSQNIFIYNDMAIERIETASPSSTQPIALVGNNLAQQIVGNAGNNQLEGRQGSDTLTGGLGQDYFYFTTAIANDVDRITDFTSVDDILMLDDGIFTGAATGFLSANAFLSGAGATSAVTASQRFIHNTTTGDVYYDADGAGGAAAVIFANIGAGTPMFHYDIFVY